MTDLAYSTADSGKAVQDEIEAIAADFERAVAGLPPAKPSLLQLAGKLRSARKALTRASAPGASVPDWQWCLLEDAQQEAEYAFFKALESETGIDRKLAEELF